MKAEVLSPQDPRWSEMLGRAKHDFYHLPDYVELCARYEGSKPAAFYAEAGDAAFLAPMLIQDIPDILGAPDDWLDVATPYGYPTPILAPADDAASLESFLEAFRQVGAEQGIVTAFFRLHPLLPLPHSALGKYGKLIRHGQTVSIDLTLPFEDIWSQTRTNHKRDIRKLQRDGFQAYMDRWELLGEFITIYEQTMERLAADEFYFFGHDYFTELKAALGERLHICSILAPTGETAAAGLFTSNNSIVQYHLGATNENYLNRAPSKLMFEHVRRWAKEAGNHVLHLGGGLGGYEDSLFLFKAGFSQLRNDYYTYRMVLDEEKYAVLNAARRELGALPEDDSEFFPMYRRPRV
jgi:hypothetical protein